MNNRLSRYFSYINRFIKTPGKTIVINELIREIAHKGLISGSRSFLHKKSPEYKEMMRALTTAPIVVKAFEKVKITLPVPGKVKVSVIIPMYNEGIYTCNCIRSVYESNTFRDYEIIVADDHSPEGTSIVEECFDNIIIIKTPQNLGFLKNCNHAATFAKGDYIVFLNNDTQVQHNWLCELLYVFENFSNVGIAGSKLVYPDGKLQEAGGIIWQDGSGHNFGNRDNPNKPEYNYIKEVDYISGASLMFSKKFWDEAGGFDERYSPAYCEDSDICFQAREKGYKVVYQPFSVVVHFEGISHGTDLNAGVKQYQVVNQKKFYDKWQQVLQLKSKNPENIFFERDRTNHKKHILIADHGVPMIDKDAGSRTMVNFIDALVALGHSVKFYPDNQEASLYYKKQLQQKGVEVLFRTFETFDLYDYLKTNHDKFDVVLFSRASVCKPYVGFLKKLKYSGKTIYYGHDLGFLRLQQQAMMSKSRTLQELATTTKAEEDYMYKHTDAALMISFDEMIYLKKYIATPLHYIPPYFFKVANDSPAFAGRSGILFVGGFSHPPNQIAMHWFLEEVYEPIALQGIVLIIAGSMIPASVYEYKNRFPMLQILPDVSIEQLDELYAGTRIAIAPMKVGAGVKGKVIEAMAMGVPVAGTGIAFEGMPKDDNFPYKGFNNAAELAHEIIDTYSNKEYWQALSDFGKDYVKREFNIEKMKAVFKEIIK